MKISQINPGHKPAWFKKQPANDKLKKEALKNPVIPEDMAPMIEMRVNGVLIDEVV